MIDRYIEFEGVPIPEPDLMKWAEWFETADRTVLTTDVGKWHVSTVFLGLDHKFELDDPGLPPILYETLIFPNGRAGEPLYHLLERYSTREKARLGHARLVERIRTENQDG